MFLTGHTKLRNIERHVPTLRRGDTVIVALTDIDSHKRELVDAGFSPQLAVGERVLPAPRTRRESSSSFFNAEGGWKIHRDKPKETAYRQREWSWEQWHGRSTITQTKIVDVPYQRYPRTRIEPPAVELSIVKSKSGEKIVVADKIKYIAGDNPALLHIVNMFRELFGEATLMTSDMETVAVPKLRRLNWEILPSGEHPWPQIQTQLKPIVEEFGRRERPVIENRLRVLSERNEPSFTAIGQGGFSGYIIFNYGSPDVFILENIRYGNATYVLGDGWESISKLTKAEILKDGLHRDRVVHREGWDNKVIEWINK